VKTELNLTEREVLDVEDERWETYMNGGVLILRQGDELNAIVKLMVDLLDKYKGVAKLRYADQDWWNLAVLIYSRRKGQTVVEMLDRLYNCQCPSEETKGFNCDGAYILHGHRGATIEKAAKKAWEMFRSWLALLMSSVETSIQRRDSAVHAN
jgi:hypothetical protein